MKPQRNMKTTLDLLGVLSHEIGMATKVRFPEDPSFGPRVLVRVLFSSIDAYCFHLKTRALEGAETHDISFSKGEMEVLLEEKEVENTEGGLRTVPVQISAKRNLLVSIRCYARVRGVDSPLPSSGDLPEHVAESIKIRNRLTHPKQPGDYNISSEEARSVAEATQWFMEIIKCVQETELEYIAKVREGINQSFETLKDQIRRRGKTENRP